VPGHSCLAGLLQRSVLLGGQIWLEQQQVPDVENRHGSAAGQSGGAGRTRQEWTQKGEEQAGEHCTGLAGRRRQREGQRQQGGHIGRAAWCCIRGSPPEACMARAARPTHPPEHCHRPRGHDPSCAGKALPHDIRQHAAHRCRRRWRQLWRCSECRDRLKAIGGQWASLPKLLQSTEQLPACQPAGPPREMRVAGRHSCCFL
jgi:hypothetical protein